MMMSTWELEEEILVTSQVVIFETSDVSTSLSGLGHCEEVSGWNMSDVSKLRTLKCKNFFL